MCALQVWLPDKPGGNLLVWWQGRWLGQTLENLPTAHGKGRGVGPATGCQERGASALTGNA